MEALIPLTVVLPLLGAATSIVCGRWRPVQRAISLVVLVALVGISIALLADADANGILVTQAGAWPAPLGISLVVDRLSGIMLVVSSSMLLTVLLYAIGHRGVESRHVGFHPMYLVLAAGVSASFVTGDLFNLFVAFEMMLAASYVLMTMGGAPARIRGGTTYVVTSLVASTLFITALALVYAATGTVNMADLSERIPELPGGVRAGFSLLLVVVFGIKAALFPLHFWLPDSYPLAPGPVAAIFAGLLTKVGVYAILRTQTLLFPPDSQPGTILLVVAGLTMLIGVLGAIAQDDLKRLFSFHIIGQVGYMIFGLGLFTLAGITAVVFYIGQTIIVKVNLFLVAGLVDRHAGAGRLSTTGGLARSAPFIAACFALPALSLAGLPPSSGFAGKFALVDAGVGAEQWWIVAVALVASLLTVFSMTKVWAAVFWGDAEARPPVPAPRWSPLMVGATTLTVALSLAYVVAAGPIYDLASRAGAELLDPAVYVDAVLGGGS